VIFAHSITLKTAEPVLAVGDALQNASNYNITKLNKMTTHPANRNGDAAGMAAAVEGFVELVAV
jgi:hypothetical protein